MAADSRPVVAGDSLMNTMFGCSLRVVTVWIVALSLVLGTGASAEATSITWDFTGSGSNGAFGNSRSVSQNGITVTATAWGYTADLLGGRDNGFQTAALGRWPTGLGVCNQAEGARCGSPEHQVDNRGADDWVLFQFSTTVDPLSVRIDPYGTWDTDVSYWVGNVPSSLNLSDKTYGDLAGLGFSSRIDQNGPYTSSAQNVGINSPPVNTLLFGAKLGGETFSSKHHSKDHIDRFKITSLTANVPEPSSLILIGIGVAGIVFWHRRGSGL